MQKQRNIMIQFREKDSKGSYGKGDKYQWKKM